MSVTFGFFNAQQVNGDYDRKYGADELAEYFASLIGDGISADIENCFKISAVSGMQISIAAGYAWINGYWIKNDAVVIKTLAVAPPSNSRIDSVILRFNKEDRKIEIVIVQGDVSSTPTFKSLTRNDNVYELMLGYITVSAGISEITSSMITDTRSNETYCGIISTFSQKAIPDGSITSVKLGTEAVSKLFSVNIPANWSGSEAPFSIQISINGVSASDIPIIDLIPSSDYEMAQREIEAWGYIYRVETKNNGITCYATEKPEVVLNAQMRCIRK